MLDSVSSFCMIVLEKIIYFHQQIFSSQSLSINHSWIWLDHAICWVLGNFPCQTTSNWICGHRIKVNHFPMCMRLVLINSIAREMRPYSLEKGYSIHISCNWLPAISEPMTNPDFFFGAWTSPTSIRCGPHRHWMYSGARERNILP